MANETRFDGQYGGLGIAQSIADSGDTAFSTAAATVTATFPLVGGSQPPVARGKLYCEVKNMAAAAVLGEISIVASDGTNQEVIATLAAPLPAVAGQGCSFVREFFSAYAKITNIVSVIATINMGTAGASTARLRVLGGM